MKKAGTISQFPMRAAASVAAVLAVFVLLAPVSSARAEEPSCITGTGHTFDEERRDMHATAPCTLGGYSRRGSTMNLTVPVDKGGGVASMRCDGGPAYEGNGGWAFNAGGSAGECIYRICWMEGRPPVEKCKDVREGTMSVSSTPIDLCDPASGGPTPSERHAKKGFCVFDMDPPAGHASGITGNTGDDMIKIMVGAEGYFESMNMPGAEGLKFIWSMPGMTKDIMMPAGPPPVAPGDPNAYADLRRFLQSPPAGVVGIEPACKAATFDACVNPPQPPPVAGQCGPALHGYYRTAAAIPGGDLCYIGKPTAVADAGTEWHWTCSGEREGPESERCVAYRPVDAQCGAAHNKSYNNAAGVIAAGLCAPGTAASTPSGTGPWSWTCRGTGTGAVSANCRADQTSVAGQCGSAQGGYYSTAAAIPQSQMCQAGTATVATDTGTGWRWSCEGLGTGTTATCQAGKPVTAQCGPANGKQFATASAVTSAGLCSGGTAVSQPSGAGPWSWTCKGTGESAVNCSAQTLTCETYANSIVLLQDLSGSFTDDLPQMQGANGQIARLLNDPEFQSRKISLATFVDYPEPDCRTNLACNIGGYLYPAGYPVKPNCSRFCYGAPQYGDYVYKKLTDLLTISSNKAAIQSQVNGWQVVNGAGADEPESQMNALKAAINDFSSQSDTPLTIVLSTDATAHHGTAYHPTQAEVANLIKSKNARLIVLQGDQQAYTTQVRAYWQGFLNTHSVPGVVIPLASNSSNFLAALKEGLTEICK